MAQDTFKINGVVIPVPTGCTAVLATTSTEDSERTMDLVMHNTPIGTIAGYDLAWKSLTPTEMSTILKQVVNRARSTWHYFDVLDGRWRDADFYASNFTAPQLTLEDGFELWEGLEFNIRSIRPI